MLLSYFAVSNDLKEPTDTGDDQGTDSQDGTNVSDSRKSFEDVVIEFDGKTDSSGYHIYPTYDEAMGIYTVVPEIMGDYSKSIDHMYVNDKTEVVIFVSLSDNYSLWTSDHMPMIAEITLS